MQSTSALWWEQPGKLHGAFLLAYSLMRSHWHTLPTLSLVYAAGTKEIVTGSLDKTIVLWRLEVIVSGQPISL